MANTATALAALDIMRTEPERIKQLEENALFMREGYKSMGFNIGHSESPIIPIIIGDNERTFYAWHKLFDAGVFVNPVISPATSPGR